MALGAGIATSRDQKTSFSNCISMLEDISANWFHTRNQDWRDSKREEVVRCCRLRIHPHSVSEEDIHKVMKIHHDPIEDEVWPFPEELVQTVGDLSCQQPDQAFRDEIVRPMVLELAE